MMRQSPGRLTSAPVGQSVAAVSAPDLVAHVSLTRASLRSQVKKSPSPKKEVSLSSQFDGYNRVTPITTASW